MKSPRPGLEASSTEPFWYKDAVIYELHVRAFADSNGDGIGDFRGLTQQLDYLHDLGVTTLWLLPFYPSPFRDDGYDISDYTNVHADLRHARRLQGVPARGAPARPAGHHRAGHQPHLRPASLVPARAPRAGRQPVARLLRLERHARAVQGGAHHLQGLRALELDLGPDRRRPTTGIASTPTSPTSTSRIPPSARRCSPRSTSGSTWASTACASTPSPTSTSARAPTARTCPRRTHS